MPRRSPIYRCTALFAVALTLFGCLTTDLPPISVSGGAFEPLPDELELWASAREEEAKLLDQVELYQDEELEAYLEHVVSRLEPPGMAANGELQFKVRVIEDPTLNAFAYPHGSMYVHTGLLARLENEDQLATVLGHELTHIDHRHMVRHQRSLHNKEVAVGVVALAAEIWLADKQGDALSDGHWGKADRIGILGDLVIGLGLQLAFLAAVNGYGRDLELEADIGGFNKLKLAGYDVSQAPRVYEILADDHGDSSKMEVFFFGSHPNLTQRIQNAKSWIQTQGVASTPSHGPDRAFQQRLRPVLRDDARLNINNGRFELAEDQLQRALALDAQDPETHLLLAGLRQAQAAANPAGAAEFLREARAALEQAISLDPAFPDPHRELGLLAYAQKDYRQACRSFERYLELAPDAEDAQLCRDHLRELRRDNSCP